MFDVTKARIASGGGQSAGGQFVVTGTIAQPLVSEEPTGGSFGVAGGFWTGQTVEISITPGDMNCDGVVDGNDVLPFVLALIDGESFSTSYPGCNRNNADLNMDQQIDGADIQRLLDVVVSIP